MQVHIIVVPFDSGVRGWRMGAGPEHLLANGLVPHVTRQGHAATTSTIDLKRGTTGEIAAAFEIMTLVAGEVRTAIRHDRFPLVLSGNCGTASGTLAGLTPARRSVFWFDAHGDANTPETTISGFFDGTALATALGWCWRGLSAQIPGFEPIGPESVVLIGTRDLDAEEAVLLDRARIHQVPPGEVGREAFEEALRSRPAIRKPTFTATSTSSTRTLDRSTYFPCRVGSRLTNSRGRLQPSDGQRRSAPRR